MKALTVVALLLAGLVGLGSALPFEIVGADDQAVLGEIAEETGSVSGFNPYNDELFSKMAMLTPEPSDDLLAACPAAAPKFKCPATGKNFPEATNVNQLRPKDIAAIMALGDSVTAGFVMTSGSLIGLRLLEDRGKVYTTGGDSGATTLANFLKVYNPNLIGDATGTTVANAAGKELNSAVTGAKVEDLPAQINRLKTQLATTKYQPIANKWKLLTLFIGANNLCNVCTATTGVSADFFETKLREAVDLIRKSFPKTLLAIVTTFRISQVWNAAQTTTYCKTTFSTLDICSCAGKSDATRKLMDDTGIEYNRRAEKISAEFHSLNDPNFTVTVLPGISEQKIAQYGQCYLSNFDCFHPNQEANSVFAISIWNNLFEKRSGKTPIFDVNTITPYCPTDSDVFA